MNDLQQVNDRLNALIGNFSPSSRNEMARSIAKKLRASHQQNIKHQQAPDGTPFKLLKSQPINNKKGRVKREMFVKFRTAKYIKARATSDEAVVEFVDRVVRRPSRNGKEVHYEQRLLPSINKYDLQMIEEHLIAYLTKFHLDLFIVSIHKSERCFTIEQLENTIWIGWI
ncbi:phage virion morphogenesis protein [Pantoea sp. USHLN256]|uniref:phage virion morphogenesis protein n=1 Tax=Pantoea sp. USHLN256 TaxID=3081293 RepID=UPI00301ABC98